jgi:hypothetical protein
VSVTNGQDANQGTFNSAFLSRTTDSDTTAKVGLKNTSDANSGAVINNAQRLINEVRDAVGVTGEGDATRKDYSSTTTVANGDTHKVAIGKLDAAIGGAVSDAASALAAASAAQTEADDLRTLSGTGTGETDLGTFTGSTIADNGNIKQALQDLEDEVEIKLDASEKGAASGVCPLDGSSKIPVSYFPSSVENLLGNWDASTNTPTLADGTGDMGDKYRVSVAGTQNLGSGAITFAVNDLVYYASGQWFKIDGTDDVHSVNGSSGAVVLDTDDISEGSTNQYWLNSRFDTRLGTKSVDALSDVDTTTVAPATNDLLKWNGSAWVPGTVSVPSLVPHITVLTSGSGTFTKNGSTVWMEVELVGGGGGGSGSGTSPGNGTAGNATTFDTITCNGGAGGVPGGGGAGGSASGGDINFSGSASWAYSNVGSPNQYGPTGGSSYFGGAGGGGVNGGGAGGGASANSGSGGGGAGGTATAIAGGGGGAGGYSRKIYLSPSSTYSYGVGASASGGTAGSGGGGAGGNGGGGIIIIKEYY